MSTTVWEYPYVDTLNLPRFRWQVGATLTVGAAADVAIAACICQQLIRFRGRGVTETDWILDRLIRFTIGELYPSLHNEG